jgi:hypothetical protein
MDRFLDAYGLSKLNQTSNEIEAVIVFSTKEKTKTSDLTVKLYQAF